MHVWAEEGQLVLFPALTVEWQQFHYTKGHVSVVLRPEPEPIPLNGIYIVYCLLGFCVFSRVYRMSPSHYSSCLSSACYGRSTQPDSRETYVPHLKWCFKGY